MQIKNIYKLILYFQLVFFILSMGTSCFSRDSEGHLILINDSNETINNARIEVCGQLMEIKNIQPHGKYTGTYIVKGDSHFKIFITFSSNKQLKDELGYVTYGFNFKHTIIVTDSSITISETKIE
jgi:hypothetical protein